MFLVPPQCCGVGVPLSYVSPTYYSRKVMKIPLSLIAIFLFIVTASAQSRTISKDEYEKVFEFAVSKTNEAYPVIFKVTTVFIKNGKTVRTVTDSNENESSLHHRIQRTTVAGGRVNAGQRVKVALAWDSNPTSDYLTDPLNADLDLYVYGPTQFGYSVSYDNSYEIVDFTAAASGNFLIKIHRFRFDGASEFYGVAWNLQ